MLLLENPIDALRLWRAGVVFDHLNLGNYASKQEERRLSDSVVIGGESLRALVQLYQEGVTVNIQRVPDDKPLDFKDFWSPAP
jgi:mannose/fructose/N-acetylgalactosamine-specific phosphotransferase system component IIB